MDPLMGVLVGGAIAFVTNYFTQRQTERREAKRLDREETERRRREVTLVRSDWAAAFMDAYVASLGAIRLWENMVIDQHRPEVDERTGNRVRALRDAQDRARVATARLLVVDTDPVVRAMAHALMPSFETAFPKETPADAREFVRQENERLTALYLAFMSFMDMLAGVGNEATREEALRRFTESSHLPDDVKRRVLGQMDATAAAKARGTTPTK